MPVSECILFLCLWRQQALHVTVSFSRFEGYKGGGMFRNKGSVCDFYPAFCNPVLNYTHN